MTIQAPIRKLKRSFTLSPEIVGFVVETRQNRGAGSDSEALDMIVREAMLAVRRQQIDDAYKDYYDTASDEELKEQGKWADLVAPNMFIEMDTAQARH